MEDPNGIRSEPADSEDVALTDPSSTSKPKSFLRSKFGIVWIVNTILMILSWCIIAGWRAKVPSEIEDEIESQSFFLAVTILETLFNTANIIIFIINAHESLLKMINWEIFLIISTAIEAILTLTVACVLLSEVENLDILCEFVKCKYLSWGEYTFFISCNTIFLNRVKESLTR
uniref:Uncharacterized protein n=1 Tax=Clytia hemisphaerica TaxID=252671 RepID=A0A7M5WRE1_9CNID